MYVNLNCPESLKNGDITAGHARAILQLKFPNLMMSLWGKILKNNLSVRASESLLKEYIFNDKKRATKNRIDKSRKEKNRKLFILFRWNRHDNR